jgi:hypothetical protein
MPAKGRFKRPRDGHGGIKLCRDLRPNGSGVANDPATGRRVGSEKTSFRFWCLYSNASASVSQRPRMASFVPVPTEALGANRLSSSCHLIRVAGRTSFCGILSHRAKSGERHHMSADLRQVFCAAMGDEGSSLDALICEGVGPLTHYSAQSGRHAIRTPQGLGPQNRRTGDVAWSNRCRPRGPNRLGQSLPTAGPPL